MFWFCYEPIFWLCYESLLWAFFKNLLSIWLIHCCNISTSRLTCCNVKFSQMLHKFCIHTVIRRRWSNYEWHVCFDSILLSAGRISRSLWREFGKLLGEPASRVCPNTGSHREPKVANYCQNIRRTWEPCSPGHRVPSWAWPTCSPRPDCSLMRLGRAHMAPRIRGGGDAEP